MNWKVKQAKQKQLSIFKVSNTNVKESTHLFIKGKLSLREILHSK